MRHISAAILAIGVISPIGAAASAATCDQVAALARALEERHQAGAALATILAAIGDDAPAFQGIARLAWERPVFHSEDLQRQAAAEFESEMFAQCRAVEARR